MGIFDKKKNKPKPDFSNVRSGGSSTSKPAPTSPPVTGPPTDKTSADFDGRAS